MADVLTIERIRDLYTWAYAWRTEDAVDEGETDLSSVRASNRAEFDAAMAAHDAEVRAKALEDAADAEQTRSRTRIMPDFDVPQVREAAARAMEQAVTNSGIHFAVWTGQHMDDLRAAAAMAVIVPAVTAQIRALHSCAHPVQICDTCQVRMPCPTVRLLDQIEAAVRGEQ